MDQPHAPELPAGLPSALLERRPDIQQAEQQLVAANAQIGVAQGGVLSADHADRHRAAWRAPRCRRCSPDGALWSVGGGAGAADLQRGPTESQVALARRADGRKRSLIYQQTIQQAFREVSDALVGYRRVARVPRDSRNCWWGRPRDARRLADMRYQGGATSYLEVLDSDTRLFTAELGLVRAQIDELAAFVEIYRALGGGWNESRPATTPTVP